jgi:hypothetical protein
MKKKAPSGLGRGLEGSDNLSGYVLAKAERGTDRHAHAVTRVGEQAGEKVHMHELDIGAEVKMLGHVEVTAAAKTVEVGSVVGPQGFENG